MLGQGVTMNMVPSIVSGAPSCPATTPVENVSRTPSCLTDSVVMSLNELYRVLAKSLAGRIQSPLSSDNELDDEVLATLLIG